VHDGLFELAGWFVGAAACFRPATRVAALRGLGEATLQTRGSGAVELRSGQPLTRGSPGARVHRVSPSRVESQGHGTGEKRNPGSTTNAKLVEATPGARAGRPAAPVPGVNRAGFGGCSKEVVRLKEWSLNNLRLLFKHSFVRDSKQP
jgi:hypothetical protein